MLSFLILLLAFVACVFADARFNLELTWGKGSPDGFEREMIFINGQFPGPPIKVQQDDWVEITVVNRMPFNTTIHAHGIEQINTPWADGVPGFSQRPIQPGDSFTYKWKAMQYGSYFYHAHSRGQIDDGCYGPLIIKPKAGIANPFDKISPAEVRLLEAAESKITPLLVGDWRHTTSERTWELQLASGLESAICMDSLLVNGKGSVDCWSREQLTKFTNPGIAPLLEANGLAMTDKGCVPPEFLNIILPSNDTNIEALPPSVFEVCTPTVGSREIIQATSEDKWLALDIISTASIATFAFSIDEHPMWVFAVDGHYIEPLKVDVLTLANGERYSVFVKLDKPEKNYGVRVASVALAQLIDTTAVLSYGHDSYGSYNNNTANIISSTPSINQAGAPISSNVTVFDQSKMASFPAQFPQPPPEVDQTLFMTLQTKGNSYSWALNDSLYNHAIDDSSPPLLYQDPSTINLPENIILTTKNNTWVDLIFQVATPGQPPHPIHKHSNKAFILGQGEGSFDWTSVAEAAAAVPQNFNLVTPPYRDEFVTLPTVTQPTWLAVRYHVVNPGAFMIHCHIQSHLNGGMAMVMLDGVDEWPEVPGHFRN